MTGPSKEEVRTAAPQYILGTKYYDDVHPPDPDLHQGSTQHLCETLPLPSRNGEDKNKMETNSRDGLPT